MGVWAAGAGVPAVWGGGDDAEARGAGAVDLLVSGVPALGGMGETAAPVGQSVCCAAWEDWVLECDCERWFGLASLS